MTLASAATDEHALVGTLLADRFHIESVIGNGGMGTVYLALHTELQRLFAIKVIHRMLATDNNAVARFRREARAASRIVHPNVTSVYDFGYTSDGQAYLVMEYVEGQTIADVLANEGPFAVERAADVLGQVASGLAAAHMSGVVHRDLKPHNVMLTTFRARPGFAKILDFGVAKLLDASMSISSHDGTCWASPAYASPEQCAGEALGPPSDIYSFGALAFELLTGKPPFEGTLVEVITAHLHAEPPALSTVRNDIPPGLERVVLRCLSKQPADRYPTGGALMGAFQELQQELRLPSARPSPRPTTPSFFEARTDPAASALGSLGLLPRSSSAEVMLAPDDFDDEELRTFAEQPDVSTLYSKALEELACAVLDRDLASPSIHQVHALKIAAEDQLLDVEAQIAALEDEAVELQQRARQREARLMQALAELRRAQSKEASHPTSAPQLEPREEDSSAELLRQEQVITKMLQQLPHQLEQQLAALNRQLDEQREQQRLKREDVVREEARLFGLLRALRAEQEQRLDPDLRILFETAGL